MSNWHNTAPSETGYYWVRRPGANDCIVQVDRLGEMVIFTFCGSERVHPRSQWRSEWLRSDKILNPDDSE